MPRLLAAFISPQGGGDLSGGFGHLSLPVPFISAKDIVEILVMARTSGGDLGQIKICPFQAGAGRDLPTWRLSNATLVHNPSQQREFPSAAKMAARVLCERETLWFLLPGSV